jgi:hypothetical protein
MPNAQAWLRASDERKQLVLSAHSSLANAQLSELGSRSRAYLLTSFRYSIAESHFQSLTLILPL